MPERSRVGVLNDYQGVALELADWSPVQARADVEVFTSAFSDDRAAVVALRDFDVLCAMRERLPFSRELLSRLPNLRCLVTTGEGNRAIDLDAAAALGVTVCGTTNGVGRVATAELTWALVLAAVKHVVREDRAIRDNQWQTSVGRTLHGKTLGVVGLGGVGRYLARYGRAFGMEVLAWSEHLTEERAIESDAHLCDSIDELLVRSDIVTLHLVLSERTRGLLGHDQLRRMKPDAILVNTSRGGLVDEDALVLALDEGRLGGAALDVFDVEPLPPDHPYRRFPDRLILSPHVGYVTEEVYRAFFGETVRTVCAFLDQAPIHVLTREAPS